MATIGINTDAVHFESRGTGVMNVSISTQVETSSDYGKKHDTHFFARYNTDALSTYLVDLVSGGGTNKSLNKATLENPITESLDMLQLTHITRYKRKEHTSPKEAECILPRRLQHFPRDDDATSSVKKNTNDVNNLIKSLISTVETERKRISSLRLEV